MDGGKRSHLLNLCGQLLRLVLIPCPLTDCRWWLESLLVHSGVSSATRRKATGADQKIILIPCHIKGEPHHWTRSTAISFAAELDGHVLGTLCAVTMVLLTNRLGGVFPRRCPVRNRPQPFATVRSHPREPYGRAYDKFCKRGHVWSFKRRVASFRVAGVALGDI